MRGVVFLGDRELEIRDLPDPTPGPGEVVIAMKSSGVCGSDLRPYRMPKAERGAPETLKAGGHEPCGVIAEVGPNVTQVAVGDRVMMHHYIGCRKCRMCRIGYTQMCLVDHDTYGSTQPDPQSHSNTHRHARHHCAVGHDDIARTTMGRSGEMGQ